MDSPGNAGFRVTTIAATVAHANADSGPFTLAIDQPYVESGANALTVEGANLTIVGIGEEPSEIRFIPTTAVQRLFSVGGTAAGSPSNATLTLGNNITLVGHTTGEHGSDFVRVWNGGNLYMRSGSKITGHHTDNSISNMQDRGFGAAVLVDHNGNFTMTGGQITGNGTVHGATPRAGGVRVRANTTFIVDSGSITGNYRNSNALNPPLSDVLILNTDEHDDLFESLNANPDVGVVVRFT